MDSAKYVLKNLAATPTTGLYYSTQNNSNLESFVTFPPPQPLLAFSDANWGPTDASQPKPNAPPKEQSLASLRSLSGWMALHGSLLLGAVLWSKGTASKKIRLVDIRENLVRENINNKTVNATHVPGKTSISDILTKEFKDDAHFINLRDSFMINEKDFLLKMSPKKSYKNALTGTTSVQA